MSVCVGGPVTGACVYDPSMTHSQLITAEHYRWTVWLKGTYSAFCDFVIYILTVD